MFSPEEVSKLEDAGVNLDSLAPNAEKDSFDYAKGGKVPGNFAEAMAKKADSGKSKAKTKPSKTTVEETVVEEPVVTEPPVEESQFITDKSQNTATSKPLVEGTTNEPSAFSKEQLDQAQERLNKELAPEEEVTVTKTSAGKNIMEALGGAAGVGALAQTGLGIASLAGKKKPKGNVDKDLLSQQQEAINESKQGLSPEEIASAKGGIESTRKAIVNNIVNMSGGNAGTALANIQAAGRTANRGILDLAVMSEKVRQAKKSRADMLTRAVASEKDRLHAEDVDSFNKNQMASANLASAGIENFLGNLRFQEAQKRADERL